MNRLRGYSVFEVLVSFAIMSMVLVVLVPGQTKLLARSSQIEARALAYDFTLSRLARIGRSDPIPMQTASYNYMGWRIIEKASVGFDEDYVLVEVIVLDGNGAKLAFNSKIVAVK